MIGWCGTRSARCFVDTASHTPLWCRDKIAEEWAAFDIQALLELIGVSLS
jgi:hypothetical protein